MTNINTNFYSSSFATAFWAQYRALVKDSEAVNGLEYSPALVQAAAILVLANVLDDLKE